MFLHIVYVILIISEMSAAKDIYYRYCDRTCRENKMHTVCKRASVRCRPDSQCGKIIKPFMTNDLRQAILDIHNKFRNTVALGEEKRGSQPSAANMNALTYSFELEHIAQCLANTCIFDHDKCRKGMEMEVGQNLATAIQSYSAGIDSIDRCMKSITSWYDEVATFPTSDIDSFTGGGSAGHYTQMVWGDIEYIGCGRIVYAKGGWYTMLLACNYGGMKTGGNLLSTKIYEKGSPASQCPAGKSQNSEYPGLCGKSLTVANTDPGEYGSANIPTGFHKYELVFIITSVWCIITRIFS